MLSFGHTQSCAFKYLPHPLLQPIFEGRLVKFSYPVKLTYLRLGMKVFKPNPLQALLENLPLFKKAIFPFSQLILLRSLQGFHTQLIYLWSTLPTFSFLRY